MALVVATACGFGAVWQLAHQGAVAALAEALARKARRSILRCFMPLVYGACGPGASMHSRNELILCRCHCCSIKRQSMALGPPNGWFFLCREPVWKAGILLPESCHRETPEIPKERL